MQAPKQTVVTLSSEEMKSRALSFANKWKGPQREDADAKTFLDEFFGVFGRDRKNVEAEFEHKVARPDRGDGWIDLFWPGKLLVEMKSTGKDLSNNKDGAARQAFEYVENLANAEERPRWVMVSDFAHFVLYDLGEDLHDYLQGFSTKKTPPTIAAQFLLRDLPDRLRHFAFIRDQEQQLFQSQPEINLKAVQLLGGLHDELKKTGYSGHQLERFLVRILFCLFAEDTDIFEWNSFTKFVQRCKKDGSDLGPRMAKLFQVLNQDGNARSSALDSEYATFPYVNGGLFAEKLDIADMTTEHRVALLSCCLFDWSKISPSIFGSLFQGVMEPKERRAKGAHYTSEENIRRVIDPLFLDDLKTEFQAIRTSTGKKIDAIPASKGLKLKKGMSSSPYDDFHQKLAGLKFFDPACGCGNFLVVSYRELRALELEVLQAQYGNQLPLGLNVDDIAKINVDQFYGIELEEFPALIAETALWLTDHQVNMAFSKAFGRHYVRIPLKKSATIYPGNALQTDWRKILAPDQCNYVLGNPPFIGAMLMTSLQKQDMQHVAGDLKGVGVLDYVGAWYFKAADYILGTSIKCAFVSTNSITQGEQVGILWLPLFAKQIKIHFAHRTFSWRNEAQGNAHVHVVIIGFGQFDIPTKRIFDYEDDRPLPETKVSNISPYLILGNDNCLTNRSTPICAVPSMAWGSQPRDGGNLLMTTQEKNELIRTEPESGKWIRRFTGAEEFINGSERWCLWLEGIPPNELNRLPQVKARVEAVRRMRAGSKAEATRKKASTPTLFAQIAQPKSDYLLVPLVSSEKRRVIPIGFLKKDIIASNLCATVANATTYHFGVMSSRMHMAWVKTTCGRLESRFRYSKDIVYNNFPWPALTEAQKIAIQEAAEKILLTHNKFRAQGSTLGDLYDPTSIPPELAIAHDALDRAVDKAYRQKPFTTDRERVEFLFTLYEKDSSPLAPPAPAKKTRRK